MSDIATLQKQKVMEAKVRAAVLRRDVFQLVVQNEGDLVKLQSLLKGAGAFSVVVHDHSPKAKPPKGKV